MSEHAGAREICSAFSKARLSSIYRLMDCDPLLRGSPRVCRDACVAVT